MMSDKMIDRLVDDLTPVKPLKARDGLALTLMTAAVFAALVAVFGGIRGDILMGIPDPMFFLRGGALLLLGLTSSYAVIAMSQPAVGNSFKGWVWALFAALLFPATAAVMAMIAAPDNMSIFVPRYGVECLAISMLVGTGIAAAQVFWLRRGAPVALDRAGWLVGMSSGALGDCRKAARAASYPLVISCPDPI